jgi:hypothetical protein
MYCSSCGKAVARGLSYCNYCGAKLNGAKSDNVTKSPEVNPALLVSAMVVLFIFGLMAIGVLIVAMKERIGFDLSIIFAATAFSLMLLLGIEGVLIRLLLRGKRGAKDVGDTERLKGQTTQELGEAQGRVLPEPVPSVTDHTTRSFEPIYNERKSK